MATQPNTTGAQRLVSLHHSVSSTIGMQGSTHSDGSVQRPLAERRRPSVPRSGPGRSGPRSRTGCATCKQRRVRCDEAHPVCGHCARLQLNCYYRPWTSSGSGKERVAAEGTSVSTDRSLLSTRNDPLQGTNLDFLPFPTPRTPGPHRSGHVTPNASQWTQSRRFDFNQLLGDLDTSWAGEFSCLFPEVESPPGTRLGIPSAQTEIGQDAVEPSTTISTVHIPSSTANMDGLTSPQIEPVDSGIILPMSSMHPPGTTGYQDSAHRGDIAIEFFQQIVQPPAAILIGGFDRWRRLQHYLCDLSDDSRAVHSALLCVVEFLMMDEKTQDQCSRQKAMSRIFERHAAACEEIRHKLFKHSGPKPRSRETMLAAVFLLAWFEVIRDQDAHQASIFPRELADAVITDEMPWNRYSQQLLSWLKTLDSKASHLGGQHLLPPKSLGVVAHYPTQITSSVDGDRDKDIEDPEISLSDASPESSHHSPYGPSARSPQLKLGQVKQVMLNTMLQPALEWYMTSQSYCRRISAHDKHHRNRFTSEDEFEVVVACKQLESELFELWNVRPAIISLTTEQLTQVLSPDLAIRLEEIFSVYLASFWVLFVYLHRISWWHLPHSTLAQRALCEVWEHMQRAYGEEVNSHLRRVIHPSLLWPLFLFGTECQNASQRAWAIEQLDALGEAKPILGSEINSTEMLPPFRLSSGATRNAKRAAALLRELIKEQTEHHARVDDRDLSMKLFGCYFSIV